MQSFCSAGQSEDTYPYADGGENPAEIADDTTLLAAG